MAAIKPPMYTVGIAPIVVGDSHFPLAAWLLCIHIVLSRAQGVLKLSIYVLKLHVHRIFAMSCFLSKHPRK